MLVIRLARTGRKKYPTYRVVAADSRRPVTGKFINVLGHYNPHTKELVLKKEEIETLVANGAQPSNSMIRLLEKEKVKLPNWVAYHSRNKASKQTAETEEAPAAAKSAEGGEPTPATEGEATQQPVAEGVAEQAAEQAAETAGNVPDKNVTETAAEEQKQAQAAEKVEEVASEAAVEGAEEEK